MMHWYTYNSNERRNWAIALFVLSGVAITGLNFLIAAAGEHASWLLTVQPPSVMAIFAIAHWFFVRHLWRVRIMQRLGIVSVPDLNGCWKGHIVSSFTNDPGQTPAESDKKPVKVRIIQSWTHIRIVWSTDESASSSEVAAIIRRDRSNCVLHYEYHNEPDELGHKDMHAHRGTVILNIGENNLKGRYYTNRMISTKGTISLTRAVQRFPDPVCEEGNCVDV